MVTNLRLEDRLDGATNFKSWKNGILFILEENEIHNHVKNVITEPEGEEEKSKYMNNEGKAKKILIDSVKDHLIPHISELDTTKMYDALVGLLESNNTSRKLALRHQLRNIMMNKSDTVATYFMSVF